MDNDWTAELADQLTFDWEVQLRPRWTGLTDEEYLWEPVREMWSVRPSGTGRTPMAVGGGGAEIDYRIPEPKPIPVTTKIDRTPPDLPIRPRQTGCGGSPPL